MNRLILLLMPLLIICCQTDASLFDEIHNLAEWEKAYKPTLIQSGKESGFLEPIMEYNLYTLDTLSFANLENAIQTRDKFKEGTYYLNPELDNYLLQNKLEILNLSKSLISENPNDMIYHVYLFSDRKSFAICKVNH